MGTATGTATRSVFARGLVTAGPAASAAGDLFMFGEGSARPAVACGGWAGASMGAAPGLAAGMASDPVRAARLRANATAAGKAAEGRALGVRSLGAAVPDAPAGKAAAIRAAVGDVTGLDLRIMGGHVGTLPAGNGAAAGEAVGPAGTGNVMLGTLCRAGTALQHQAIAWHPGRELPWQPPAGFKKW